MTGLPPLAVRCGNCGADVPVESLSDFTACGHCGTALYIGRAEGVVRLVAEAAIPAAAVPGLLARRLAQLEIAGKPAELSTATVRVPYWRVPGPGGRPRLVAAAFPGASGLDAIDAPGEADLAAFDPALIGGGPVPEPGVSLEDALAATAPAGEAPEGFRPALVHVPVHRVEFTLGGRRWRAAVEAISGRVEADEWPPSSFRRRDRLLGAVALSAFVAFLAEAVLLPGPWPLLLGYAATAGVTWFASMRAMGRLEA